MRPLVALLALALAAPALAVPLQLNHQGTLADSAGLPLEGVHQLTIAVFADASGGAPLWTDTLDANLDRGAYSVILGAGAPLDPDLFDGSVRYVEISVDGGAPLPQRLPLTSVPYAVRAGQAAAATQAENAARADVADALSSPVQWDDIEGAPDDQDSLADLACDTGDVPTFDGAAWTCASPTPAQVDVTTLNGTIDVDNLPVGTGSGTVAAGDHTHSFGQITGQAAFSQLPTGTSANQVATGDHGHALADLTGDLPLTRTTGSLDLAARTTGNVPYARLPVGTTANTVAAGNHTHTAADVGALPAPSGTGTLALPGAIRLGTAAVDCTVSSNAGTIYFEGGELKACVDGTSVAVAGARLRLDQGAWKPPSGALPKHCKGYRADASYNGEGDGLYWIDPASTGTGFKAWCDMTTSPGGWTRVSNLSLQSSGCVLGTGATGDPAAGTGCNKYTDAIINQIAEDKIYFAAFSGYPHTYTKYEGSIRVNGNSGRVVQADSYAGVATASFLRTPGYSGWLFFHQQDWYQGDTCIGTAPATHRLSLEYIVSSGNLYSCSGNCSSNCPSGNLRGSTSVYLR